LRLSYVLIFIINLVKTQDSCNFLVPETPLTMPRQKRNYKNAFLDLGFTDVLENGVIKPKCVICKKVLSPHSLKKNILTAHLKNVHADFCYKDGSFFRQLKEKDVMHRTDDDSIKQNTKLIEASYFVAYQVAKTMKPHSIAEKLVKPCLIETVKLILGHEASQKMQNVSVSNDTIRSRIDDMSQDVLLQIISELHQTTCFSLQIDESTDVAQCAQLVTFVRYIANETIKEEFLFSHPLSTTTRGEDIFKVIVKFFEHHNLSWDKLTGICTDGAPAMIGYKSGFSAEVVKKAPHVKFIHCIIHRYALAMKTLPDNLKSVLSTVVQIINYIKTSATKSRVFAALCEEMGANFTSLLLHAEVRWLSRGKILTRFVELHQEITRFLSQKKTEKEKHFHKQMVNDTFLQMVSYLSDFFAEVNTVNLHMQGNMVFIPSCMDKIEAFVKKLQLYKRLTAAGQLTIFPNLSNQLTESKVSNISFTDSVIEHINATVEAIQTFYPGLSERCKLRWILKPFTCDEDSVTDGEISAKIEFLTLREDYNAKEDYNEVTLPQFWIKQKDTYPILSENALKCLVHAPTTYRCEQAFSAMVNIKSAKRNKLRLDSDLRLALSTTLPNMKELSKKKQAHPSH